MWTSQSRSRRRRTVSPAPALEQDVVRHDDGGPSVNLQQRLHVLQEVQLLVARARPEIGALHHQGLPLRLALGVNKGEAGLPSEGRIGQHHVEVDARMGGASYRRR